MTTSPSGPDRRRRGRSGHTAEAALDLEHVLGAYGELAVRVGVNLQPGQRLLVIGPIASGGVSLDAAPLVRSVTAAAYRAGAPLVEVLWGDEALLLARFAHAPRGSFADTSAWLGGVLSAHADAGGAILSVYANDPDLLRDSPQELTGVWQQAVARSVMPFRERIARNATNWSVMAGASPAWAARVFPGLPSADRMARLWQAIARLCRLDGPDPVAAWNAHVDALAARRDYLESRRYTALTYRGPGTDLTIGLPHGHRWVSARSVSGRGVEFTANIPTEEVFTMPDARRVEGTVRGTKPLSHGGTLIDGFSLTFDGGRVVGLRADRGETMLRTIVETDAGASRLGEVALVPHRSPISQSGLLFYNTLFDENAACHIALGTAYRFTLGGGEHLSDDAFVAAGGNLSAAHVDLMIGSGELDIDGVTAAGTREPVMRAGEWAF